MLDEFLRRYSLASLAGVVSDEDDDAEAAMPRSQAKENAQKAAKPAQVTNLDEHKKTRISNPKAESAEKGEKSPQKSDKVAEQTQKRVQKIRMLFNLSAKLGQTPEEMKAVIGNLIGIGRPIKESAEIKDSDIDTIIDAFSKDLEMKEAA